MPELPFSADVARGGFGYVLFLFALGIIVLGFPFMYREILKAKSETVQVSKDWAESSKDVNDKWVAQFVRMKDAEIEKIGSIKGSIDTTISALQTIQSGFNALQQYIYMNLKRE